MTEHVGENMIEPYPAKNSSPDRTETIIDSVSRRLSEISNRLRRVNMSLDTIESDMRAKLYGEDIANDDDNEKQVEPTGITFKLELIEQIISNMENTTEKISYFV